MALRSSANSPYDDIDKIQRWSNLSHDVARAIVDAQGAVKFTIDPNMRLASAGSCFAARIAEHMRDDGAHYLVTEKAPSWFSIAQEEAYGYRPFSARYGFIYTSLQLLQLFERAYGRFIPTQVYWERDGRFIDPFRPRSSPSGYATVAELVADRTQHFAAVRTLFERADVFCFTLGLTELWRDRRDGAVYPYCPGTTGGTFDPDLHEFHNLDVDETTESLRTFVDNAVAINPKLRFVFSVSPVPLGATMEPQHVARATTYSKSVLRVALERIYRLYDCVDYFAAYEMVSQSFFGRDPFTDDRRHLKAGIAEQILSVFRAYYLPHEAPRTASASQSIVIREQTACDEDILSR